MASRTLVVRLLGKLTISQYRFLLKYASRDTIELLGKGTAGVSEARVAVEEYEEKSPLYGLVQYRRRKVILKYVPDGTSRLLQGVLQNTPLREHY